MATEESEAAKLRFQHQVAREIYVRIAADQAGKHLEGKATPGDGEFAKWAEISYEYAKGMIAAVETRDAWEDL